MYIVYPTRTRKYIVHYNDDCFSFTTTFHNNNKYIIQRLLDSQTSSIYCVCLRGLQYLYIIIIIIIIITSSTERDKHTFDSLDGPSANKTDVCDAMDFCVYSLIGLSYTIHIPTKVYVELMYTFHTFFSLFSSLTLICLRITKFKRRFVFTTQ